MLAEQKQSIIDARVIDRAVLYARVSSDDRGREGRNLESQIDMGREYATKKGYTIVAELSEDNKGASGAEIDLPQLNRVGELARNGQIDVLIVRELDRLSRNLAKQLVVEDELKKAGVRVEYVLAEYEDTPEGRLNKHIRATISEYEREKIKERMTRGRYNKVKAGKVLKSSKRPYGYQFGNDTLEICEAEAKIVRLIFKWCVDERLSSIAIAKRLTDMKIPTHTDVKRKYPGRWGDSTIRAILVNETYIGNWHYGKRAKIDGKWGRNQNRETVIVKVQAIIDEETFEAAQRQLASNRNLAKRNTKNEYLFGRRLRCGCGAKMHGATKIVRGTVYQYYRCNAVNMHLFNGRGCGQKSINVKEFDNKIWGELASIIQNPDELESRMRGYQAVMSETTNPLQIRLIAIDELIDTYTHEWEDAMCNLRSAKGKRAKAVFGNDVDHLEKTIDDLEAEKVNTTAKVAAQSLTDDQIVTAKRFARRMADNWDVLSTHYQSKRDFVDLLDMEITIFSENGKRFGKAEAKLSGFDVVFPIDNSTINGAYAARRILYLGDKPAENG